MYTKTREILDSIDEVLSSDAIEAGELWNVLTALRGPDNYNQAAAKNESTTHFRRAAFPKAAVVADKHFGFLHGADYTTLPMSIQSYPESGPNDHFWHHARAAASALGLT